MLKDNGNIKPWEDVKVEFYPKDTQKKKYWLQILDALTKSGKGTILKDLVIFNHHIVRKSQLCSYKKHTCKEWYLTLVDANSAKSTAQGYFENLFKISNFNSKKIYLLTHNITLDTKACIFQYNISHNTLYANKMLPKFGKVISIYMVFFF